MQTGQKMLNEKAQTHVHMPPELLVSIEVPITVLKSSYLLPSLIHRLESLMLASQLREEIAFTTGSQISSSLVCYFCSANIPGFWLFFNTQLYSRSKSNFSHDLDSGSNYNSSMLWKFFYGAFRIAWGFSVEVYCELPPLSQISQETWRAIIC